MAELREQLEKTLNGTYIIEGELGGGGMSRVFVALEQRLKRRVVVKVLSPEMAAGLSAERFEREIQTAASLQQANILTVLTAGDTNGLPYYTMPYVDGESLRSRLASGVPPVTEVVGILKDVARALAYAHERGVVHRDIKPDNVLLSGGAAVVTDFGIAKALSAARTEAQSPTLTQIGTSIGTPAYMAPEQAAGDEIDSHADIYSLGCMAYELLAGHPPFWNRTPPRILAAHMGEAPQPIAELRPDTPAALAVLVMRCLSKDAPARPSATDVIKTLESVTSGSGMAAMPPILIGGRSMLVKALAIYAMAFVFVAILARAAILAIGLPDWVFPGSLVVMALGLPVILFTGYVAHVNRRLATATPTFTPGGTPSLAQPAGTMATIAVKATPHVSWRRTAMGGVYALGVFAAIIVAFMTLRALGIGPAGSLFAAGRLKQHEKLLVADFGVGSADSSLGSVVAEAIRTDLGQSTAMSVVPASAIRAGLQRMQRPATSKLDLALARDLAQREGIKAVVHGDVTPIGNGFIVTVRLLSSEVGDELASFRETADGPKDLIPAVDRLTRSLRAKIGESLRAVHATPALSDVTTPSLEALRKYTEALGAADVDNPRAIALLQDAIAIDTGFAMAWRKLAVIYFNASYPSALRDSAATHAFKNRERLTRSERANVEGFYWGQVIQDREKEMTAYQTVVNDSGAATHNLALAYQLRREYATAESLYRMSAGADGGNGPFVSFQNLAVVLFAQGKWQQGDSVLAVAEKKFGPVPLYRAHVVKAAARAQIDSVLKYVALEREAKDAFVRAVGWRHTAELEMIRGRLAAAERALAQERLVNTARGALVVPLADSVWLALEDTWFRSRSGATVRRMDDMLAKVDLRTLPREQRPYFDIAAAYAIAGRPDRARAMFARYDADVRDTMRARIDAPVRQRAEGEMAVAEKRYAAAIDLFRRSDLLPDGPVNFCAICLYAAVGRAFDLSGQSDSAITYFERYLTEVSIMRLQSQANVIRSAKSDAWYRAATLKRLGELYEARGDRARAIEHYREFVDLWKDADPELQPKVADVRRRLTRLAAVEAK